MRPQIRRIAALATLAIAVLTFAQTRPAEAHTDWDHTAAGCLKFMHASWIGSMTYRTYSNGTTTCDGDNNYVGRVRDDHATNDGYCVRAVLDGITMTVSCDSAGSGFSYTDPQRDWYAWTCITEASGDYMCFDNYNF